MSAEWQFMDLSKLEGKPLPSEEERRAEDERKALMVYKLVREIANNNSNRDTCHLLFSRKIGTDVPGSGYLSDYLGKGARRYIGR